MLTHTIDIKEQEDAHTDSFRAILEEKSFYAYPERILGILSWIFSKSGWLLILGFIISLYSNNGYGMFLFLLSIPFLILGFTIDYIEKREKRKKLIFQRIIGELESIKIEEIGTNTSVNYLDGVILIDKDTQGIDTEITERIYTNTEHATSSMELLKGKYEYIENLLYENSWIFWNKREFLKYLEIYKQENSKNLMLLSRHLQQKLIEWTQIHREDLEVLHKNLQEQVKKSKDKQMSTILELQILRINHYIGLIKTIT